jgi:hypothetical protein
VSEIDHQDNVHVNISHLLDNPYLQEDFESSEAMLSERESNIDTSSILNSGHKLKPQLHMLERMG